MLAAGCVFLLIVAGALVTSNDAGLSVPDWPTSFGSLYRIPHMVNGVQFEHTHRMIAELCGLLTIAVAVWTQKVDRRRWMRVLAWCAVGTVIAQGILGGLTVIFYLPPAVSTAHATLGQTYFCLMVSIAFLTSRKGVAAPEQLKPSGPRPALTTLAPLTVAAVWLQLIMGAAFRHSGIRLLPHLMGAALVLGMVSWLTVATLRRHGSVAELARPAKALLALLAVQITLGAASYVTRVIWDPATPAPLTSMVLSTVAHVACGALLLAVTVLLTIQVERHLPAAGLQPWGEPLTISPQGQAAHSISPLEQRADA